MPLRRIPPRPRSSRRNIAHYFAERREVGVPPRSQQSSVTAASAIESVSAASIRLHSKGNGGICRRSFITGSPNAAARGGGNDDHGAGSSSGSDSDSDDDNDSDSEESNSASTAQEDNGVGVDAAATAAAGDGGRALDGVDARGKSAAVTSQWEEAGEDGHGDDNGEDLRVLPIRGEATQGRFSRFGPGRELGEFDPIREEALEGMYPSFEPSLEEILDDSHLPVLKDPFEQKGRLYRSVFVRMLLGTLCVMFPSLLLLVSVDEHVPFSFV